MKHLVLFGFAIVAFSHAFAKDAPAEATIAAEAKRKPASADCVAANKELAQTMLNNAAKRISHKASEVSLRWTNAVGERFVYSGSIYKGEYEIIVKTDSSCFPLEVELVDLARK